MLLEVKDLEFGYSSHAPLFSGLCFDLGPGDTLAVVAPSGRGKSTLLLLLGGYLRPTRGSVLLDGAPATRTRSSVSWVFQTNSLLPSRTVVENVALPLLARGIDRATALDRSRELIASVGLAHRTEYRASSLSGGEAQRVGVARALASPAKLLLADEPTANLDRENAMLISSALFSTAIAMPLVLVTHDAEVAQGANRVLDLNNWAGEHE